MPRKRRGRPTNWTAKPRNGIAIKGVSDIVTDVNRLSEFVSDDGDPARGQFVRALLEIGEAYAKSLVEPGEDVTVAADTFDNEDVEVERGVLQATGDDILFWEFGTGVTYAPGSHPRAAENNIRPASFSETHAGWLTGEKLEKYKGKWPYKKEWTYGQPPRMAMWDAAKEMRDKIPDVAKQIEVF